MSATALFVASGTKTTGGSPSAAAAAAGRGESAMMKDVACCFFGVLWFGVRFETA
jgi:hypothetical protein